MFSSCHCLEGYFPKMIVVPDYEYTLQDNMIKFLVDTETIFTDKETGEERVWKSHSIETGKKDIIINAFDGCGIHHPKISEQIMEIVGMEERPTTMMLRAPYIKGLTAEVDYTRYYHDHGINFIQDVWGKWHSVDDVMIIITESMYKGKKYFKNTGTYEDWDNYWSKFHKYNHCIGIAKWNFTSEQEPVYTRGNYQILQDLDLEFDDFKQLATKSLEWAYNITSGDELYTYCFLGLANDNPKPLNAYAKAVLRNPEMLKEDCVKDFLKRQVKKYIDKMKCGKLYLKACYKFWLPDLIMFLEWVGGDKEPQGSLEDGECWSIGYDGDILIERNPHICKSEHLAVKAVHPEELEKYCGHLVNTCLINCKSLAPQRLNGSDFDGDLVLLVDEPMMLNGIDRNCPIVINIDEKKTALEEEFNKEHIADMVERTLVSLIGECSNAATCYHNRKAQTDEQKLKYESYVDILSIVNSFAIDVAKTGYIMQIPYHIAKYSKPYPYFMRYISDYYENLYQSMERSESTYRFNRSYSNMNRLAILIDKFHNKEIKWKRNKTYGENGDFDYTVMLDDSIEVDDKILQEIEKIYKEFNEQIKYLSAFENKLHMWDIYKDELKAWDKESAISYKVNWQSVYDKFRNRCEEVCPDKKKLANACVIVCYEKHKSASKRFLWAVASSGLLENIKRTKINLPHRDENGKYEYLGKKYSLVEYDNNE